jgi:ATP-dependent DNA helicase PIF1
MTEQFLFPELSGEEEDTYREVTDFDHLVGSKLTASTGKVYKFVAQLKNKEGDVLYRVINPDGKLEMVPKVKFDKKDNFKVTSNKHSMNVVLSEDQQAGYDYIINDVVDGDTSKYYFVTGGAGTGKTTFINHIRRKHNIRVTGSTGMAAQHVKGSTIFRFLGIRPEHVDNGIPPKDDYVQRKIGTAEIVVVDEISMIDTRLFNLIFDALSSYRIKVIFVGDFFQLPPVNGTYCFLSPNWNNVIPINLSTNHRQSEHADFFNALNELRWGTVNEYMHKLLMDRQVDKLPEDCVNIMSKRIVVERTNQKRLRALGTEVHKFEYSLIQGNTSVSDDKAHSLIKSGRIPVTVTAAVGSRVMFLTNHQQNLWVNGSLGTVVRVRENEVKVELDAGHTVVATYETHEINDSDGKTLVSYSQLPIDLAWAMTVHKAQGTSVDKVGVDMTNHFAAGMTYVALSRARTPQGLFVKGRVNSAIADPRVIQLYRYYTGR